MFEVPVVAKFLSARDKLCTLSRLNKAWNAFIFKPYAWATFRNMFRKYQNYEKFLSRFSTLEGAAIEYEAQLNIDLLLSASFI